MEPTELEALELERTASVARYICNYGLERCQQYYQQRGKSKPWAELSAELTKLKQTELWLYDFDSRMLQQALADLRRAGSGPVPGVEPTTSGTPTLPKMCESKV